MIEKMLSILFGDINGRSRTSCNATSIGYVHMIPMSSKYLLSYFIAVFSQIQSYHFFKFELATFDLENHGFRIQLCSKNVVTVTGNVNRVSDIGEVV